MSLKDFLERGLGGIQDQFVGITPQDRFEINLKRLQQEQAERERQADELYREQQSQNLMQYRRDQSALSRERFEKDYEQGERRIGQDAAQHEDLMQWRRDDAENKLRAAREAADLSWERDVQDREDEQAHDREMAELRNQGTPATQWTPSDEADLLKEFTFENKITGAKQVDYEGFEKARKAILGRFEQQAANEDPAKTEERAAVYAGKDPNADENEIDREEVRRINAQADQESYADKVNDAVKRFESLYMQEGGAPNEGPPTLGIESPFQNYQPDQASMERKGFQEFKAAVDSVQQGDASALGRIIEETDWDRLATQSPELVAKMRQYYQQATNSRAPF